MKQLLRRVKSFAIFYLLKYGWNIITFIWTLLQLIIRYLIILLTQIAPINSSVVEFTFLKNIFILVLLNLSEKKKK